MAAILLLNKLHLFILKPHSRVLDSIKLSLIINKTKKWLPYNLLLPVNIIPSIDTRI